LIEVISDPLKSLQEMFADVPKRPIKDIIDDFKKLNENWNLRNMAHYDLRD